MQCHQKTGSRPNIIMTKSYDVKDDVTSVELDEVGAAEDGPNDEQPGKMDVVYRVNQSPPLPLLCILALQQFLTMFGATFSYPLLLADFLCISGDPVGLGQLISTVIFVSGLSTLLQTTLGVRLPIIQSISYGFVQPAIVLLSLPKWENTCLPCLDEAQAVNATVNSTRWTCGSEEHTEIWQARLRELQGAMLVSAVVQVLVGFSGLVGLLMSLMGPLTIAPTIAMIGLSLFDTAAQKAAGHWWIALLTVALMALFSQYLRDVSIPLCGYRQGQGCVRSSLRFFALFPVLLSIGLAWLLCYAPTISDALPSHPENWGYVARTDIKGNAIADASWFRFPYPGQWGVPTVSVAGVLGFMAAVIASIVESVGDYHACARLSGAPPPPASAIGRGIGVEGITCLLAGAWGTGGGTTSYSENIGAIGITKVGSLAVIQMSGLLMVIIGCVGKFSAIFVTLPDPIIGGLFLGMFSMVTAVGLSNLQHVDLNSSRNLFVLGLSLLMGLSVPKWLEQPQNAGAIDTGSSEADNILTVLASTSMFVSGVVGFVLDNTIPGTAEERGIHKWRKEKADESVKPEAELTTYDLPLIQPWLNKIPVTKYLPFCPAFKGNCRGRRRPKTQSSDDTDTLEGQHNMAFQ